MSEILSNKQKLINEMKQIEIEIKKIQENENQETYETLIDILKNAHDRAVELDTQVKDLCKMKCLVDSWSKPDTQMSYNPSPNTRIAMLFKEMIANNGEILSDRAREILNDKYGTFYHITEKSYTSKWCLVFRQDHVKHYINQEAIDYFHEKNQKN